MGLRPTLPPAVTSRPVVYLAGCEVFCGMNYDAIGAGCAISSAER
jgi:hypothetical protein